MFEAGFLGTRAPFFMDVVTLIVAALPLLVVVGIYLAKKKMYKLHAIAQNFIFVFSVVVVAYFELGVRLVGGFNAFIEDSGVSHTYASVVLVVHVLIAVTTLYFWIITLFEANKSFMKKDLPGVASGSHRKHALKTFIGIVLTSFTGIWVYLLLFIF
jgi:putative membrane protein